ncbi:MAG: hypothetical protein ACR2K3_12915 [Nocardioides sp.]
MIRNGLYAPAESGDIGLRKLTTHEETYDINAQNVYSSPNMRVVGQFDPRKIEGFSALSQVPLTTYYPPSAAPGDAPDQPVVAWEVVVAVEQSGRVFAATAGVVDDVEVVEVVL